MPHHRADRVGMEAAASWAIAAVGYYGAADVFVIYGDDIEIELREIAENLHREDLKVLERSDQIARWAELTAIRVGQVDQPLGGAQPAEKGISKLARDLNMERKDVERSVKVAALSPEAKAAAVEHGLLRRS